MLIQQNVFVGLRGDGHDTQIALVALIVVVVVVVVNDVGFDSCCCCG